MKRQLYQCFKAKVNGDKIHCSAGHRLGIKSDDIHAGYLKEGKSLVITTCQNCPEFEYMGEPLMRADRGW